MNFNKETSFGYRFAMLHRLLMAMCRKDILTCGIQPSQLPFLLRLVRETGPVTQDHLSNCLAIDKGTTARAMGQLEAKGFIIRRTNPENRRQKQVSATPKARDAATALLAVLTRAADDFVRGFTPDEKKLVLDLMDRMLSNARNTIQPSK